MRHMDTPLSETANTLKLEEIRKRCAELSQQPLDGLELTLEDGSDRVDGSDPYNRSSA